MSSKQKTIYTCDLCGKEFDKEYRIEKMGLAGNGVSSLTLGNMTYEHICEHCFRSFEALVDNCKDNA